MHSYFYHPGPAQVWLSRAPNDDLKAYHGDGDWFKVAYAGPLSNTEWVLWNDRGDSITDVSPSISHAVLVVYPKSLSFGVNTGKSRVDVFVDSIILHCPRQRHLESTCYVSSTLCPRAITTTPSGISTVRLSISTRHQILYLRLLFQTSTSLNIP